MRKLEERAARRKAANRAEGAPETQDYDDLIGSDECDSDDGRTLMTGATGLTRKTKMSAMTAARSVGAKSRASSVHSAKQGVEGRRLPNEKDGEVLNILGVKEKNVRFAHSDDSDSDDGVMEFDDFGRLLVMDESNDVTEGETIENHDEINMGRNKRRKLGNDSESVKGGAASKKKGKGANVRQLGAAYKSRRAGGDVKKKGQKFEPYAYVPLDGRSYSRKNRRRAVEQMATVVPQGGKRKRN